MMRCVPIAWIVILLSGCGQTGPSASTRGVTTETIDAQSGTLIRTRLDASEIGIADRLFVEVRIEWQSPAWASMQEVDWAGHGWSVIFASDGTVAASGDERSSVSTYLVEPFLPGEYTIPPFEVELTLNEAAVPYVISTEPLLVEVLSSLAPDDAGELSFIDGVYDPSLPAPPPARSQWLMIVVLAGLAGSAIWIGLYFHQRRMHEIRDLQPGDLLEQIMGGHCQSESEAYDRLYQSLCLLNPGLQQTSEIRGYIEICEEARFSPSQLPPHDPTDIARQVLDLLCYNTETAL